VRVEEARDTAFAAERTVGPRPGAEAPNGVVALIGRDPQRAAAFIERELGPVEAARLQDRRAQRRLAVGPEAAHAARRPRAAAAHIWLNRIAAA
jgi:hypothetical protein